MTENDDNGVRLVSPDGAPLKDENAERAMEVMGLAGKRQAVEEQKLHTLVEVASALEELCDLVLAIAGEVLDARKARRLRAVFEELQAVREQRRADESEALQQFLEWRERQGEEQR